LIEKNYSANNKTIKLTKSKFLRYYLDFIAFLLQCFNDFYSFACVLLQDMDKQTLSPYGKRFD